jgi:hypothetical protein
LPKDFAMRAGISRNRSITLIGLCWTANGLAPLL